ncbi:unnamed protein product [Leptosia nina]|uniref:Hexosyltransferase n=1 Tax=Leptosia nina TaxID=320188 RepID=A0AAV1JDA5_9NEOP
MASPQNVTVEQMRNILSEVINTLESPDYASKLDEAKEAAGNEMLKMMQLVFPMVVQIEMETIKRHGFTSSREGIVQFTQLFHSGHVFVGWLVFLYHRIKTTKMRRKRVYQLCVCSCVLTYIYYFFGVSDYLFSKSFENNFDYPLNIDIKPIVKEVLGGQKASVTPINYYPYRFLTNSGKCSTLDRLDLFIVVKSAMNHFEQRSAIRQTFGKEGIVPGKMIKTLFFLGVGTSLQTDTQHKIEKEMATYKDIIQIDFLDTYFNNTIKTMMSLRWLYEHCSTSDYYLFTDDDMYISVKNLLDYVHSASEGDRQLYVGYVFKSIPQRFRSSKWRVSLEEYPWDSWPPYVTAGAFVLTNKSMRFMYAGSLFVKHFRFDDIYLGIVAKKVGIEPVHCPKFHFYKKKYSREGYRNVIASHGYGNKEELIKVWTEQNEGALAI